MRVWRWGGGWAREGWRAVLRAAGRPCCAALAPTLAHPTHTRPQLRLRPTAWSGLWLCTARSSSTSSRTTLSSRVSPLPSMSCMLCALCGPRVRAPPRRVVCTQRSTPCPLRPPPRCPPARPPPPLPRTSSQALGVCGHSAREDADAAPLPAVQDGGQAAGPLAARGQPQPHEREWLAVGEGGSHTPPCTAGAGRVVGALLHPSPVARPPASPPSLPPRLNSAPPTPPGITPPCNRPRRTSCTTSRAAAP